MEANCTRVAILRAGEVVGVVQKVPVFARIDVQKGVCASSLSYDEQTTLQYIWSARGIDYK